MTDPGSGGGTPWAGSAPPGWYPQPDGRQLWWDGYQWHDPAAQQAPMGPQYGAPIPQYTAPYQSPSGLGTAARVLVGLTMAVAIWSVYAELHLRSMIGDVQSGSFTFGSLAGLQDAEHSVNSSNGFTSLLMVVGGIVTVIWIHRVFTNLHGPLRSTGLEHSPGWAVGWWFIPFANLVKVPQVVNEGWAASGPDHAPNSSMWMRNRKPITIIGWWLCTIVGGLVGRIGISQYNSGADDFDALDKMRSGLMIAAIGDVIFLAGGVMLILVISDICRRQDGRAAMMASAAAQASGQQPGQGPAGYPQQW